MSPPEIALYFFYCFLSLLQTEFPLKIEDPPAYKLMCKQFFNTKHVTKPLTTNWAIF